MDKGLRQDLSNTTPLVSVIVPAYNMEAFLAETLQSVLASTHSALEIIVVDDGSTDSTLTVARSFAALDTRVSVLTQPNGGPCRARNHGVATSAGKYLLPLDADDLIAPHFIAQAVSVLESRREVKVVTSNAEKFGEKVGAWRLPPFSLRLLAHKNIIPACALYRREDFDRIGGYCEAIIAREDWDFWISLLKDGGDVVRLPEVGLYYRVRHGSKRFLDRGRDSETIALLNLRHAEFFERELGGPLRRMRSWSRCINRLTRCCRHQHTVVADDCEHLRHFVEQLPREFAHNGKLIFQNRNAIKQFEVEGESLVVKQFCLPHLFNRFAYRFFRSTKAARSFRNAQWFLTAGVGTPQPIGFCDTGSTYLIGHCYYVSRASQLRYNFRDLPNVPPPLRDAALTAIAQTTARMHEAGYWHKDYSGGNVLWDEMPDGSIAVEIIDLNRLRIGDIAPHKGALNLAALRPPMGWRKQLVDAYAAARGADPAPCLEQLNVHLSQFPD